MKKIVALVLSLVMVLGLATTAFAATASNNLDNALAQTAYTAEVKPAVAAAPAVKAFATYQIYQTNVETKAVEVYGPYAEMVGPEGATAVCVDGSVIRYFGDASAPYTLEVTAVELTAKAVYDCGDLKPAATGTYYVDAKGNYYTAAATGTVANCGGKMVYLTTATVGVQAHDYVVDTKTVAGVVTATAVSCKDCKCSFSFVVGDVADAVAKFGAGNYVDTTKTVVNGNVTEKVFVAKVAGSAPSVDGEKVESAETFDAGIAMYVGMSVMAAAGSAVVLKKKD